MCKLISINTNYGEEVKVADIKSVCIENLINVAPICNHISEIILFGSALEEKCTDDSDIDIAIISKKSVSALSKSKAFSNMLRAIYTADWSQEYDKLYFTSMDEIIDRRDETPICEELIQKGKVIYRRDVHGNTNIAVGS